MLMNLGRLGGAAVIIEKETNLKIPAIGCHHHYVEILENACQRKVFGATTSPEEGYAKRVKTWWNDKEDKTCDNVCIQLNENRTG